MKRVFPDYRRDCFAAPKPNSNQMEQLDRKRDFMFMHNKWLMYTVRDGDPHRLVRPGWHFFRRVASDVLAPVLRDLARGTGMPTQLAICGSRSFR